MRLDRLRLVGAAGLAAMLMAGTSLAQDFHGFDPSNFDGSMVSAEQYAAMVEAAKANQPPRNGDTYLIGFANLTRDVSFTLKVEEGILANAEAAGVDVQVADNRLDGATALANAQSFIQRGVDYVIEFQTDANFGATIMQQMDQADTRVVAIDIPMGDATFFGANNPRSGFMGGAYLGQAAIDKFGAEAVAEGYFVVGELPQSGAVPAMRTNGQVAGFRAVVENFPDDNVIFIDTKNTLEESFTQMNNVIGRIPEGVPIMVTAINDQAATGMLRAAKQAGREADLIVVGMGADEIQNMLDEPTFVASVGYFPERYGNYLIPLALMELAGEEVPDTVLVTHYMVSDGNVCEYYEEFACAAEPDAITFEFPQEAFEAHLAEIRELPELQDSLNLIPAN
ncbi:sugar ABC transporter substrate-binding protein [Arsenicitalea aurantiaca]|uniref:Sugar ABC transporter substrate-binding protein n=1 Tax=Arsenicitalea aurantiaca TaxID=1783274 RepID=A0A433XLB8_9HYPH|nr:sugar ABC transporter substrate-binding protein [Arsenicitalea aurantiaca]RUT34870.1 sugar ABC transporter substrate-binding protein [Arsenicitalea aurantiaca]